MYDTEIKAKFPLVVLINEIIFTSYRTGELIPNLYLYIFFTMAFCQLLDIYNDHRSTIVPLPLIPSPR